MRPMAVVTENVITNTLKCFQGAGGGRHRCGKQPYDDSMYELYVLSYLVIGMVFFFFK